MPLGHELAGRQVNNFGLVKSLINPHQLISQVKHIIPQRNDNKLRILRPLLNIIAHNGHILKIQGRINLVHEVQRRRLVVVQGEDQ